MILPELNVCVRDTHFILQQMANEFRKKDTSVWYKKPISLSSRNITISCILVKKATSE